MVSIQSLHTFQLDQNAIQVIKLNDQYDIQSLKGKTLNKDFVLLGAGSNCIFLEDLLVPVYINSLQGIEVSETSDEFCISVASGENWHNLVEWTIDNGIYGFENLALIPGTVGAAPIQNIGAYGKEVNQYIDSVEYFCLQEGVVKSLNNHECMFAYRDSIFKHELLGSALITKVNFVLPKTWKPEISYGELKDLVDPTAQDIFNKVIEVRRKKLPDPRTLGNAGSFFKNPILDNKKVAVLLKQYPEMPNYKVDKNQSKLAAGWLIDQCGLKGAGNEFVSMHKNQALVMVNHSMEGRGHDVKEVAEKVIETVFEKFGIRLEPEVRCFGKNGQVDLIGFGHDFNE